MFFFGVKKERDPWIARQAGPSQDDNGGASHKLWRLGEAGQKVNKKQNAKGFCQINPTD